LSHDTNIAVLGGPTIYFHFFTIFFHISHILSFSVNRRDRVAVVKTAARGDGFEGGGVDAREEVGEVEVVANESREEDCGTSEDSNVCVVG